MLSTISNGVKRYPLVTFFVLAYALTLVFLPIGQLPQLPMVAAIIVLAISEGKPGLKELLSQAKRWRVGWGWYLIALGLIIYDRQLWFGRTSPVQPEVASDPAAGFNMSAWMSNAS